MAKNYSWVDDIILPCSVALMLHKDLKTSSRDYIHFLPAGRVEKTMATGIVEFLERINFRPQDHLGISRIYVRPEQGVVRFPKELGVEQNTEYVPVFANMVNPKELELFTLFIQWMNFPVFKALGLTDLNGILKGYQYPSLTALGCLEDIVENQFYSLKLLCEKINIFLGVDEDGIEMARHYANLTRTNYGTIKPVCPDPVRVVGKDKTVIPATLDQLIADHQNPVIGVVDTFTWTGLTYYKLENMLNGLDLEWHYLVPLGTTTTNKITIPYSKITGLDASDSANVQETLREVTMQELFKRRTLTGLI